VTLRRFGPVNGLDVAYALSTVALGGLLDLWVRQAQPRLGFFFIMWILIPYAVFAALLVAIARDPGARRVVLALDVATWFAPLILFASVDRGPANARLWLSIMLVMKIALLLGILARAIMRQRIGDARAGWLLCAIAAVFFVAPLPFTRIGFKLHGDEPHYLVVTMRLLQGGDFSLEGEYARQAYRLFCYDDLGVGEGHVVIARNGHAAPAHDLGLSIIAAVPYLLGGWILVLVAMAGAAGLVVREIFLSARLLGASAVVALAAAAAIGLSPPFVVFSTQVFPEIPAALATTVAARAMLAPPSRRRAPLVVGVALAVLPWLHMRFWMLAVPLALGSVLIWRNRRATLVVMLSLAASAIAYTLLNYAVYGQPVLSPFLLPRAGALTRWAAPSGLLSAAGIVLAEARPWLDSYDGLLLISPIYIFAVAALPGLLKDPRRIGPWLIAAIVCYSALVGLQYARSTAGDSPPGRFMVVVTPLLGLALACQIGRQSRRFTLALLIPLAAMSGASTLVSLSEPLVARYPFDGKGGPIAILGRALSIPTSFPAIEASAAVLLVGVLAVLMYRVRPPAPHPLRVSPKRTSR
jgi:hypothetical protein